VHSQRASIRKAHVYLFIENKLSLKNQAHLLRFFG